MPVSAHEIISDLKRVRDEIGKIPTFTEYVTRKAGKYSERAIQKNFGGWRGLIAAAGLDDLDKIEETFQKKGEAVSGKKPFLIESIHVHEFDLAGWFDRHPDRQSMKGFFWPDTHVEHKDDQAVDCALEFLEWYQPDLFCFMGDFLNAGGISPWDDPDLSPKRLMPEIKRANLLIDRIQARCGSVEHWEYLEGNHEFWIQMFMGLGNNPQFFDGLIELGIDISFGGLLKLKQRGINLYPLNDFLKIGNAHFTHGIFTGIGHPRKHLLKLKDHVFYGHLHDASSDQETSLRGTLEAQSLGCLCNLRPKFLRGKANNWSHNVGQFEFFRNGKFTRTVPRIQDGLMSFAGKIFGNPVLG